MFRPRLKKDSLRDLKGNDVMSGTNEELPVDFVKNSTDALLETGLLFEINRKILHPFGLALSPTEKNELELIRGIDDPEGFVYDEETFITSSRKFSEFFSKHGEALLAKRKWNLGYIIQNYPDPLVKVNGLSLLTKEDNVGIEFTIPYDWARTSIREWYDWSIEEFGRYHDIHQSYQIYVDAKESGVIISEDRVSE